MYSLSTFYTSKEWIKLISILKLSRVREDEILYCEHCNQAITKKYDCIAHHKKHLTEDNVNDFNISMNEDNVMLVHFRCHNEIHKRFGFEQKKVYIVYGSPCAGKSYFVKQAAGENDIILDIDKIYYCISNNSLYVKSNRLSTNVFLIRDSIMDMIKSRTGKWENAWIVGGFPFASERERIIQTNGAIPIYVEEQKEICLQRAIEKGKEWEKYINSWWEKYYE